MTDLQEFQCKYCGGRVVFDSESQNMKCQFCDSEFPLADFEKQKPLKEGDAVVESGLDSDFSIGGQEWEDEEKKGMNLYVCESCGGEIIADQNMGASKCPYCENNIVMKEQFKGDLKPELIIPFKLDKEAAKNKYFKHLEGKRFLPRVFKDQNHIDEIKGVYVPFWLYDATVDASIVYEATQEKRWSDNNYNYVETSYYDVRRDGNMAFERIPADASSKMPDDLMESIEPFDNKGAVPFNTAYLAGYMADKYDVEADHYQEHIRDRVKQSTKQYYRETVKGYDSVNTKRENIRIRKGEVHYAMYPVWLLNTTWNGQKFTFAMNGQTGKMVGNLPLDKGAFYKTFAIMAAGFSALACALTYFMGC